MRSAKLLAVAVLAVVLALSSAQNAFAKIELAYDDGTPEFGGTAPQPPEGSGYGAILFSLPSGWSTARLVTFKFYKCGPKCFLPTETESPSWAATGSGSAAANGASTSIEVHILGSDGVRELTGSFKLDVTIDDDWNLFDLTSRDIVVPKDFYVAIKWLDPSGPLIGLDIDPPIAHRTFGQSCDTSGCHWVEPTDPSLNAMGRVEVDPIGPVGGFVEPVNTFALLTPWLAVIGLVGCVGVVAVVVKRSRS